MGPRVAVFCDDAFRHGHDRAKPAASLATQRASWEQEVESTMPRDRLVDHLLHERGWLVVRLWDFEIVSEPEACFMKVADALRARGARVPPPA